MLRYPIQPVTALQGKERAVVSIVFAFLTLVLIITPGISALQTSTTISFYGSIATTASTNYYIDPSVTDFRTAINNIIQNAVTPATIHVATGTYTLSGSINNLQKNNIEIAGAGMGKTIIVFASNQGYTANMFKFTGASSGWYIHDLTLDGNGANQGGQGQTQIILSGLQNSIFERVEAKNTSLGGTDTSVGKVFDMYDCNKITIRFSSLQLPIVTVDEKGKLIVAATRCSQIMVHHNMMIGGSCAVNFYDKTHDSYAINNICQNQGSTGIVCYMNNYNCRASGNTITDVPVGMYIQNSGYSAAPCYNNIFDNNTISGVDSGIWVNPGAYNNYVVNNSITTTSYGINVRGHDNEISGNTILGGTSALRIESTTTSTATANHLAHNKISGAMRGLYIAGIGASNNIEEANSVSASISASIDGTSQNGNRFSGNTFKSSTKEIIVGAGATGTVFEANTLLGGLTSPIQDSGAGTLFRDYIETPIAPMPTLPPLPDLTG